MTIPAKARIVTIAHLTLQQRPKVLSIELRCGPVEDVDQLVLEALEARIRCVRMNSIQYKLRSSSLMA